MRLLLLSVTIILAGAIGDVREVRAQSAYDYPICAIYHDKSGATACYYSTYEQCMATMSGIGGHCASNPFYRGHAAAVVEPPPRRARRHY